MSEDTTTGIKSKLCEQVEALLDFARARDGFLNLRGLNLRCAILEGANLSDADLYNADLSGVILTGANLAHAHLAGADLRDAHLYGALIWREPAEPS